MHGEGTDGRCSVAAVEVTRGEAAGERLSDAALVKEDVSALRPPVVHRTGADQH